MIQAVVFDMDDTLYDEADYCRSGFKAVAHFLSETLGRGNRTKLYEALWEQFSSGNRREVFDRALEQLGLPYDESLIRSLIRIYRGHKPNLRLPRDSCQVLNQLKGKYKLGLLTDGYLPAQRLKFQALKLSKWITTTIYTEQLGRNYWKPHPMGFERLRAALACSPDQIVYVGDNLTKDFIAPNQLGWTTILVRRPAGLHINPPPMPKRRPSFVWRHWATCPNS